MVSFTLDARGLQSSTPASTSVTFLWASFFDPDAATVPSMGQIGSTTRRLYRHEYCLEAARGFEEPARVPLVHPLCRKGCAPELLGAQHLQYRRKNAPYAESRRENCDAILEFRGGFPRHDCRHREFPAAGLRTTPVRFRSRAGTIVAGSMQPTLSEESAAVDFSLDIRRRLYRGSLPAMTNIKFSRQASTVSIGKQAGPAGKAMGH